jgi:thymidylate synthase
MARLIHAADNLGAWRAGTQYLLDCKGEASNLVLEIDRPVENTSDWHTRFDPRREGVGYDRIRDVANTIFPDRTHKNSSTRVEFYARYAKAHDRRRHHFRGSWGTYFGRLTSFGASKENQLERAIATMGRWTVNHKAAIVLHTSSAETDGIRTRGGPCLQYIQILCPDRTTVDMLAVYRSHDYFNKTLGNLVGLGRLQKFIATESGRRVGRLVCHSTHAFLGAPRKTTRALLAR